MQQAPADVAPHPRTGDNMASMSTWGPIIAVVLALIAAASVAVIAWKLTSDKFEKSPEETDPAMPGPPT